MIEIKKQPVIIDTVSLSPKLHKKNIDRSENTVLTGCINKYNHFL